MEGNRGIKLTLAFGLLLLSGCTTDPGETTTAGAVTGGALGAGLGAIVGSATGDAGTGLVLGGAAGAAAGGAIGNSLEGREQVANRQQERLQRQQQKIAAQRTELDALRKLNEDQFPKRSKIGRGDQSRSTRSNTEMVARVPQRVAVQELGTQKSPTIRTNERNIEKGVARSDASRAESFTRPSQSASIEDLAQEEPIQVKKAPGLIERETKEEKPSSVGSNEAMGRLAQSEDTQPGETHNQETKPSSIFSPIRTLPTDEADKKEVGKLEGDQDSLKEDEELARLVKKAGNDENPPSKTTKTLSGDETTINAVGSTPGESSSECSQSADEMKRGQVASETADQLFHYRRALRLCPNSPAAHNALGELYLKLKRESDAQFEFREALNVDSTYKPAKDNLDKIKKGSRY